MVAGCTGNGPSTGTPVDDPLARAEMLPGAEIVGDAAGPWPMPVVRVDGGWIVPWRDRGDLVVRFVGDDGTRADRFVDRGTFLGAARLDGGYAIAVAADGAARVHFVTGDGDELVTAPLDGTPVAGAASDGTRVLVAATRGGEI